MAQPAHTLADELLPVSENTFGALGLAFSTVDPELHTEKEVKISTAMVPSGTPISMRNLIVIILTRAGQESLATENNQERLKDRISDPYPEKEPQASSPASVALPQYIAEEQRNHNVSEGTSQSDLAAACVRTAQFDTEGIPKCFAAVEYYKSVYNDDIRSYHVSNMHRRMGQANILKEGYMEAIALQVRNKLAYKSKPLDGIDIDISKGVQKMGSADRMQLIAKLNQKPDDMRAFANLNEAELHADIKATVKAEIDEQVQARRAKNICAISRKRMHLPKQQSSIWQAISRYCTRSKSRIIGLCLSTEGTYSTIHGSRMELKRCFHSSEHGTMCTGQS
jgi:hypothetical protein